MTPARDRFRSKRFWVYLRRRYPSTGPKLTHPLDGTGAACPVPPWHWSPAAGEHPRARQERLGG